MDKSSFLISIGKSRKDIEWKLYQITWDELCKKLETPVRTKETMAEYFRMSKDRQSDVKDVGGFVGGDIAQDGPDKGRRKAGNVQWRSLVTLDADNVPEDVDFPALVEKALPGIAFVCYTTHSHTPNAQRWRVIIPLDYEGCKADEYPAIARRICEKIGMEYFDRTTCQPERLMFWPSCPCDAEPGYVRVDGECLAGRELLKTYVDWRDATEWPQFPGETWDASKARRGGKAEDPTKKDNIVGVFCRAYNIHQAIRRFLPTVYKQDEHDPNRYTYTAGHTSKGLVVYDDGRFCYSNHSTDPICGQMVNAFDLVRIHLFGSYDNDPERPANRQPSWDMMAGIINEDDRCREQIARDLAQKNADDFGDIETDDEPGKNPDAPESKKGPKDWMVEKKDLIKFDKKGKEMEDCMSNVVLILENDPRIKDHFSRNLFSVRTGVTAPLPWSGAPRVGDAWDRDNDQPGLKLWLERQYRTFKTEVIRDAVIYIANKHAFHPVRDYLDQLKWDGKPRLETALIRHLGVRDNRLNREVTRKFFVAAVARIYSPGCKFDYALALSGKEGIGKSSFCKIMGGPWHTDSVANIETKDGQEQLRGVWIVEMAELDALKKANNEKWKQFIACAVDRYRRSYGTDSAEYPRQCVFIITTNEMNFLLGDTGNRRIWIVDYPVDYNDPWNAGKTKALVLERDQLWAEAVAIYNSRKENLYLDPADEMAMRERQLERNEATDDPRRGMIEQWLSRPIPLNYHNMTIEERQFWTRDENAYLTDMKPREHTCPMEIATVLLGMQQGRVSSWDSKAIRQILNTLGWTEDTSMGYSRFDKVYGRQRWFTRPVTELMVEKAKEATRRIQEKIKEEFEKDKDDLV